MWRRENSWVKEGEENVYNGREECDGNWTRVMQGARKEGVLGQREREGGRTGEEIGREGGLGKRERRVLDKKGWLRGGCTG